MSSFELDPVEMRNARKQLADQLIMLQTYRNLAGELARPMRDGDNLVAEQMRKAYLDRADTDNGVQAVLNDYIAELTDILTTIDNTLSLYESLDEGAAELVRRQAPEMPGELS